MLTDFCWEFEMALLQHVSRSSSGLWQCNLCSLSSNKKSNVLCHVESKHLQSGGWSCQICKEGLHQNCSAKYEQIINDFKPILSLPILNLTLLTRKSVPQEMPTMFTCTDITNLTINDSINPFYSVQTCFPRSSPRWLRSLEGGSVGSVPTVVSSPPPSGGILRPSTWWRSLISVTSAEPASLSRML